MKRTKIKRKEYLKMRQDMYEFLSKVGTVSESLSQTHPLFQTYLNGSNALDEFEAYGYVMGYLKTSEDKK